MHEYSILIQQVKWLLTTTKWKKSCLGLTRDTVCITSICTQSIYTTQQLGLLWFHALNKGQSKAMTYNTPTIVGCFTAALAIILLYYTLPAANLGILQNDTLYPTF